MYRRFSPSSRIRRPMFAETGRISGFGSRPGKGGGKLRRAIRFRIAVDANPYIIIFSLAAPNVPLSGSEQDAQIRRPFRRSDGAEASPVAAFMRARPPESRNRPIALIKTGKAKRARSSFSFTASLARRCATFYFFLWRFLRRRFFRLWVAILWRLCFFPFGIVLMNLVNWIR